MTKPESLASFHSLSTDQILDCVEKALGRTERGKRATGSIFALNSLENRVHRIEFEDSFCVVSKFYRPGRWNFEQIQEEHDFLDRLHDMEIPVVPPLSLIGDNEPTIGTSPDGIFFTVFPFVRGRLTDELDNEKLEVLGRYLGRIHRVGSNILESSRPALNVQEFGLKPLEELSKSNFFETEALKQNYQNTVKRVLDHIAPRFQNVPLLFAHGDCHLGNTLWNDQQAFFLDFDDARLAPAVQDIWMVVRGRDEQAQKDRESLLNAYRQMNDFNDDELALIEPLRALRIIHHSAWIAKRWDDPSFKTAFPDFGKTNYWQEEMAELYQVLEN